jgi:hypothetical protein
MSSPQFYDDFGDSFFEEQQQQSRREQREQRGDGGGGGGSGEEGEGEDEGLPSDSEDEDEGEYLNADSLGDWRELRRRLQDQSQQQQQQQSPSSSKKTRGRASNGKAGSAAAKISGEDENAALLETQCEELAREYRERAWAHPTPTVRCGALFTFAWRCARPGARIERVGNKRHAGRQLPCWRQRSHPSVSLAF